MHLAIEAVGAKHSGGAVVFADVAATAALSPHVTRLTLFTSPRPLRNFDVPAGPHVSEYAMPEAEGSLARRIAWYERGLARAARDVGADVVLCMSGLGRTHGGPRHVTFIQQSLPYCPEALATLPPADKVRFRVIRALVGRSVRTAAAVYTQTPTMVDWVSRAFGVARDRMDCFIPVARDLPTPAAPPATVGPMLATPRGDRLLYVGNTSAYKNVESAIAAMPHLRRARPGATLFLTWPKDHPAARAPGVVPLGYLDPAALAAAYDAADLLLQPSLVESGPLTMNEAMARGTAVACADRPYGHDMCESAAVFFDPQSPEDLARVAAQVLDDAGLRGRLVDAGRALVARRRASNPYDRMMRSLASL